MSKNIEQLFSSSNKYEFIEWCRKSNISDFNYNVEYLNTNNTIFGHYLKSFVFYMTYNINKKQTIDHRLNIIEYMLEKGASWSEKYNESKKNKQILLSDYAPIVLSALYIQSNKKTQDIFWSLITEKSLVDPNERGFVLNKFDKISKGLEENIINDNFINLNSLFILWSIYTNKNNTNSVLVKDITCKAFNSIISCFDKSHEQYQSKIYSFDIHLMLDDNFLDDTLNCNVRKQFFDYVLNNSNDELKDLYFTLCQKMLDILIKEKSFITFDSEDQKRFYSKVVYSHFKKCLSVDFFKNKQKKELLGFLNYMTSSFIVDKDIESIKILLENSMLKENELNQSYQKNKKIL